MKKIMQNKSVLHRLIACVMAAVMLLTMVAVDSHFHLFAEEDQGDESQSAEVDITGMIDGTDTDISEDFDAPITYRLSYKGESETVDTAYIYAVEYTEKTPAKSINAETPFTDAYDVDRTCDDVQHVAVYYYDADAKKYGLKGTVYIHTKDIDAPVIDAVIASDSLETISGEDGSYLKRKGGKASFSIEASDGDKANATGVATVKCSTDGGAFVNVTRTANGYVFAVKDKSAKYTFKAIDGEGNESDVVTMVVKNIGDMSDPQVSIKNGKITTIKNVRGEYILNKDAFNITVSAHQEAGDKNVGVTDIPLYLRCVVGSKEFQASFVNGTAVIQVPKDLVGDDGTDISGKLSLIVFNGYGEKKDVYGDEGPMVFLDRQTPSVTVNGGDIGTKWQKSGKINITASTDNSYISNIEYSIGKKGSKKSIYNISESDKGGTISRSITISKSDKSDISKEGSYTVYAYATNVVDNTNIGIGEHNVLIDYTAPEIILTSENNRGTTGEYDWFPDKNKIPTISVACADRNKDKSVETSGIDQVTAALYDASGNEVAQGSRTWEFVNNEVRIKKDGKYKLVVKAVDKAGNSTTERKKIYVNRTEVQADISVRLADGTALSTEKTCYTNGGADQKLEITYKVSGYGLTKSDVRYVYANGGFDISQKDITADDLKSLDNVKVAENKDGTTEITYTFRVNATSPQGYYYFSLRARKNGETEYSIDKMADMYFDITGPEMLSLELKGNDEGMYNSREKIYYYNQIPTATVTMRDNSGKYTMSYTINDEPVTETTVGTAPDGTKTKRLELGGCETDVVYKIVVTATDKASNKASEPSTKRIVKTFVVNTDLPEINFSDMDNYSNGKVRLSWKDTTDNAPMYEYQIVGTRMEFGYDSEGNPIQIGDDHDIYYDYVVSEDGTLTTSKVFSAQGVYELTLYATDYAGNTQTKNITFRINGNDAKPTVKVRGMENAGVTFSKDKEIRFIVNDPYGVYYGGDDGITVQANYKTYDADGDGESYVEELLMNTSKSDYDSGKKSNYIVKSNGGRTYTITYRMREHGAPTDFYFVILGTNRFGDSVIRYPGDLQTAANISGVDLLESKTYYVDETAPEYVKIYDAETQKTIRPDTYYNKDVSIVVKSKDQYDFTGVQGLNHDLDIAETVTYQENASDVVKTKNGQGSATVVKKDKVEKKYTVKGTGKHDIKATFTDMAGNSDNSKCSFYIDKEKPTVQITNAVDKKFNNADVTVNFTLADNMKGNQYWIEVEKKNASGEVVFKGYSDENGSLVKDIKKIRWSNLGNADGISRFVSLQSVTFGEEGTYTVTVHAADKAGNEADTASVSFTIDRTAPVIDISGVNDRQSSAVTATISVDEAFALNMDGYSNGISEISADITKKTDGTAATSIATLGTASFSDGRPHTATYNFSEDGEYTITVNAMDASGNRAASVTKTFKVDANAPVIKVQAVDNNNKEVKNFDPIGSMDSNNPNYVDMTLNVEETFFTTDNVQIAVKKDSQDVSGEYFKDYSNTAQVSSGAQRFSEDGVYEISITAQDELGNKAEDYSLVFTVDNTAPNVKATTKLGEFLAKAVRSDDGNLLLNASDFADIQNQGYDAFWDVSDTSDFTVDAKIDGVDLIDFSDMSDGYHKVEMTVTDKVGHVSSESFDFTYDGTAPRIIITGVEDGETMREPFTMTIGLENDDDEITSIVINGNTIDPSAYKQTNKYEMQVDQYDTYKIEVTAMDKAGNIASTFDKDSGEVFTFRLSEKMSPIVLIIIITAAVLLIALLIFIIIAAGRKRRKKAAA